VVCVVVSLCGHAYSQLIDPEDGGCIFLRNAGVRLLHYTVSQSTCKQYED
jgi:hypothetical protein